MADVILRGFPEGQLSRGLEVAERFARENDGATGFHSATFYTEGKPSWKSVMAAYRTKSGAIVVRWLL